MTPDRWARIEEVFHKAIECDATERAAVLERKCANDPELRREVESLLLQSEGDEESVRRTFHQGALDALGPVPENTVTPTAPAAKTKLRWWMVVLVASFLTTFAFISYLIIRAPAELSGLSTTFIDGAMVINTLEPNSLLAKSGMRAGDRVLSIDMRPMRASSDWIAATGTWEVGRPHRWLVARDVEQITFDVIPQRPTFQGRMAEGYWLYLGHLLTGLLIGLLIAWKRPSDPVAQIGSWFLMTASIAFGFPQGWAAVWRNLPALAQLPLWITQISRFVLEGIFYRSFSCSRDACSLHGGRGSCCGFRCLPRFHGELPRLTESYTPMKAYPYQFGFFRLVLYGRSFIFLPVSVFWASVTADSWI
jgi:hypothetical protein